MAALKPTSVSSSISHNLTRLAAQVSQNQNKSVRLNLSLALLDEVETKTAIQLQQIGIQLIRNSICHGIETAAARVAKGKPAQCEISISTQMTPQGAIHFSVRDDGQGIVPMRIRAAMVASGRYSMQMVDQLSDKDVVKKLFEPGFSTASTADKDAGSGVGMDLIQSLVNEIGGELKIDTKPDVFTQFTFRIAQHKASAINLESSLFDSTLSVLERAA